MASGSCVTNASALRDAPGGGSLRNLMGTVLRGERPSRSSAHTTTAAAVSTAELPRRGRLTILTSVRFAVSLRVAIRGALTCPRSGVPLLYGFGSNDVRLPADARSSTVRASPNHPLFSQTSLSADETVRMRTAVVRERHGLSAAAARALPAITEQPALWLATSPCDSSTCHTTRSTTAATWSGSRDRIGCF